MHLLTLPFISAPCNPGTQRDPTTGVCTPCPTNMYSAGKEESCQTCGTGTVGRRDFIWKTFQEMPVGVEVKPSCTGTCGSTFVVWCRQFFIFAIQN
jgi:hypothetical protein